MADQVLLNKADIIERSIKRIREIYDHDAKNLRDDQNKQDAFLLNLESACQASHGDESCTNLQTWSTSGKQGSFRFVTPRQIYK